MSKERPDLETVESLRFRAAAAGLAMPEERLREMAERRPWLAEPITRAARRRRCG